MSFKRFIRTKFRCQTTVLVFFVFLGIYFFGAYNILTKDSKSGFPKAHEKGETLKEFRIKRYENEKNRLVDESAPGERGKPVLLNPEEKEKATLLFPKETYNVVASAKISMNRKVPDTRPEEYCLFPHFCFNSMDI